MILCCLTLLLGLLCLPSAAAENSRVLREVEAVYTVAQDGSCAVELTLRPGSGVGAFEFPLPAQAQNVQVFPNGGLRRDGQTIFVSIPAAEEARISCRLPENAAVSGSGQRFALRLLLPSLDCTISSYKVTITLPKPFETMPGLKSGYYGDNIDNYMRIDIRDGVIAMESLQPLRDHESLDFSLELPGGYFDLRFLAGKTATVDAIAFWALLLMGIAYWIFFLRNRLIFPRAQAMPPLSGNAGVTPYLLTGETPDLPTLVMQWASLGYLSIARTRKGKLYLKKQIDMGSERKSYEQRAFRSIFARSDLCAAHGAELRQARENFPALAKGFWQEQLFEKKGGKPLILRLLGVGIGLAFGLRCLDAAVAAQSWRWFLIVPLTLLCGPACWLLQPAATCWLHRRTGRTLCLALLGLIYLIVIGAQAKLGGLLFVCVLAQLLIGLGLFFGGRRTKQGLRLAGELLGLRRYLRKLSPAALKELLEDDPQFFYRMLPYADALCVGGRFAKQCGGLRLEPCTWLTSETVRRPYADSFLQFYRLVRDELREQTESPLRNLLRNLLQRRKKKKNRI